MPLFGPPDVTALKAKRDVQGLIKALGYGGDGNVRRAAVAALADLGDVRAVEPLCLAMKHEWENHDWSDTQAVADALVRFGAPAVGPLIALLDWHSKVVRVAVAGALAAIGRPAVRPLIALLGDSDLETRETASQILADIGPDAIDDLIAALTDANIGRRQRAARVLGDIGDSRAVGPLTTVLRDPIAGVRQAAARSLGQIGDARAGDYLVPVLKDGDLTVRRSVALALADLKDVRAAPQLLVELRGPKPEPVLEALGNIGPAVVEPMLIALEGSRARGEEAWIQDELRSAVSTVFGRLGCQQEVVTLVLKLFAEDGAVQSDAAGELMRRYQSGGMDDRTADLIRAARPLIQQTRATSLAEETDQPNEPATAAGGTAWAPEPDEPAEFDEPSEPDDPAGMLAPEAAVQNW